MPTLLDPIKVGSLDLPNRIIMSPMTRVRAVDRMPNDLMREYYVQRASAGLIITEGVSVAPQGVGYPRTPGIWSTEQIAAWRVITDAVHNAGGRIFAQTWHVGRMSDPEHLGGQLPVSASSIAPDGHVALLRPERPYVAPRALETWEVPQIAQQFRVGAENAMAAGFDGVHLHCANGYILDCFLYDGTNKRGDEYGGTIEKRARVMLDAIDASISVWGSDRVGIQIGPRLDVASVSDSDPLGTFSYLMKRISERNLALVVARESLTGGSRLGPELRKLFTGTYVANEGFTPETGNEVLARGEADAVAFGNLFIANPDLPARIAIGGPLNATNPETLYASAAEGYTDYQALTDAAIAAE
ncbi:alkene reductase [Agrobacterium vitis]|uniref:alkene reductase n=1 Tax=Agrobacterium vitis TaxID=373 RepID=UPI0012E77DBE|nr:alkene reductase [Agrobacterium vitis]MUZ65639.1 alkene reductase [Agrobacterium vitis]